MAVARCPQTSEDVLDTAILEGEKALDKLERIVAFSKFDTAHPALAFSADLCLGSKNFW